MDPSGRSSDTEVATITVSSFSFIILVELWVKFDFSQSLRFYDYYPIIFLF